LDRLSSEAAAGGLAQVAAGYTPVYPCRFSPRDIWQHPLATGPFKFVGFKPNESIRLARNPDYWKRLCLDGIEYTIVPNGSTAILAFIIDKFELAVRRSPATTSAVICLGRRSMALGETERDQLFSYGTGLPPAHVADVRLNR
jgi:ABC-type oligopeptide transport system substrate-binding subunit